MAGPRLEIELLANMVRLQGDMNRAVQTVEGAMGKMRSAAATFGGALAAIGAGVSLGGLASQFQSVAKEMDDLNDLADKTGASIESLSGLSNALAPFGHAIDTVGTATDRLVKAMQGADEESKGAGQAFAAIGVQARDASGNLRPAVDVLHDVAKALSQYADGANKTAIAQAIFGKSGAALLPMLKDLNEAGRGTASVTTEMAAQAEQFNIALGKMSVQVNTFKQGVVGSMLPGLLMMIEQFNIARQAGLGLIDTLNTIATPRDVANGAGKAEQIKAQTAVIEKLNADIAKLERSSDFYAKDRIAARKQEIALEEQKLAVLRKQAAAQGLDVVEANFPEYKHPTTGKPAAPALPKIDTAGLNKAKAEAERIRKLGEDAIVEAQRRLAELDTQFGKQTAADKMLFETTKGRYAELGKSIKDQLLGYAQQEDAFARMEEQRKRFLANEEKLAALEYDLGAEMQKIANSPQGRNGAARDAFDRAVGAVGSSPLGQLREQQKTFEALFEMQQRGTITLQEYNSALLGMTGNLGKQQDVYDRLGLAIEDAFDNNAIKDFGSAISDLGNKIQAIFYRELITEPLMRQIKGFIAQIRDQIGGAGGSSSGGNLIGAIVSGVTGYFSGGAAPSGGSSWLGSGGTGLSAAAASSPGLGLKSAAPAITISQTLYTDARSDLASIQTAMVTAKNAAVSEIMRNVGRGGSLQRMT